MEEKIKKYLLSYLVNEKNIKVEKADVDAELDNMASMYGMTREQLLDELTKAKLLENYTNQIASSIFMGRIKEFLVKNN